MWIYVFIVTSNFLLLTNSESACKLPNTGTVLFRNIDLHRRSHWSREEFALLYTRRAMMELIPKQIPHNIPLILEYIQICLTTLKQQVTNEEVYDYMLAALADTFGGYLQTYGLPLVHESFYEGYVSYDGAADFHRLQDNFKSVLMTNGEGWTKPMEVRKHINRILPLKMPLFVSKSCNLLFTDAPGLKSAPDDTPNGQRINQSSLLPIPILDDNKNPNSIAIPFKNRALFNLKSRNSYDILIKYYIEATRCLAQSGANALEQSEFDRVFSKWIKNKVVPHLKDETWYVGFSNVLRIEETIQQKCGMIGIGQESEKQEESLFSELGCETQFTRLTYIIVAVILLVSLIVICFLYWALIKRCILCCGRVDVESSAASDQASLLDDAEDEDESATSRHNGLNALRDCRHSRQRSGHSENDPNSEDKAYSQSGRTVSETSKYTMSCGLGKGLPSRCLKHNHK